MKVENYPKFTIIMRGYTYAQADAILQAMAGFENQFAVEVTLNTTGALDCIAKLNEIYGDTINIGAGTVTTLAEAKAAFKSGAKFLLGPCKFTKEILDFTAKTEILAIPGAMTPSEVSEMFAEGADIVKIFPAAVVTPRFFKDIQAPLGQLPLMAVGGISMDNAGKFLASGASYLGIGSGMFNQEDIQNQDVKKLAASLEQFLQKITSGGC